MKQNTFIAAATWYDDGDCEPVLRSRHRENIKGSRVAGGMSNEVANSIDHLSNYSC